MCELKIVRALNTTYKKDKQSMAVWNISHLRINKQKYFKNNIRKYRDNPDELEIIKYMLMFYETQWAERLLVSLTEKK